jgi:hypothetical protein
VLHNTDIRNGKFKKYKVSCHKCNKEFEVEEREKLFPKKEKYFCSRSCANSLATANYDYAKKKLSKCKKCNKELIVSIHSNNEVCDECRKHPKQVNNHINILENKCDYCGKDLVNKKISFCTVKCSQEYNRLSYINK